MDPCEVVVIGGRSGVGKTSVALALHARLRRDEVRHVVVEGDYLDMAWPAPPDLDLAMRNLQAVWANFRSLGHHRLIYTNTVSVLEIPKLVAALGRAASVTAVLLTATDATADARLASRESGAELETHRVRSLSMAARLDDEAPSAVYRMCTDDRTPDELAAQISGLCDWKGGGP
jgi:ABC-type glutathione transport system ATPase component